MITINSPAWHDDGIVEIYAILLNATNKVQSRHIYLAKLMDAQDALHDACLAFTPEGDDAHEWEQSTALFDALAFVTEAIRGRCPWVSRLRSAMYALERLKSVNHVHQV